MIKNHYQKWSQLMVILITLLCLLVQVNGESSNRLRIGFWNIRDFSSASRDSDEIEQISKVVHLYDCLAICELNDTHVLEILCKELEKAGGQWNYCQTSKKVGNTSASAEYYGFVYRADKLTLRHDVQTLPEVKIQLAPDKESNFDREPCVGFFKTRDGHFDFSIIVVHITWGSGVAARKGEIKALSNYFKMVRDEQDDDKDVILCGDFNRNVNDQGSLTELLKIPTILDTTDPTPPTKVDSSNTYDHLLLQKQFFTEYEGLHGVYLFDQTMFNGDIPKAKKVCSDHRPVWIMVNISEKDDD